MMKWCKRLTAAFLSMVLLLCTLPFPASARQNKVRQTEATEPTVLTETEESSEPGEPAGNDLTPEGNLSIVDDVTDPESGKEFLTVVTRNGNYFYLIIDRDGSGKSSVHFLNLVDERDLLELLSEEEIQDYQEQQTTKPTVPDETETTEPEPTKPVAAEPDSAFDPQMDRETMILLCIPIGVLIVGGFAAYIVFSRKKPKSAPAPSEDDDWDYDLPEEDDDAQQEV